MPLSNDFHFHGIDDTVFLNPWRPINQGADWPGICYRQVRRRMLY